MKTENKEYETEHRQQDLVVRILGAEYINEYMQYIK